ncbi:uncharacterized protein LOC113798418 [Dermatophagoides pteronyssinus]|uniref:Uncharacterized protein LOC113798418 n=1 Tax=Dermatophagoides pteronyssinus TaxID=6956 RepID=A0A6P6YJ39_DERPT|nr:uncharacterized protein LOC113798418 [Dermatophagoides pteronyssinus]
MTLQSKLSTCHCLNVQLIHSLEQQQCEQQQQPSFEKILELLGRQQQDNLLDKFLNNSKLIKIIPNGIQINYEYLCLKRIIDNNLQIYFCTVCELETHAIFISNSKSSSSSNQFISGKEESSLIAFVNSSLLTDEKIISELKLSKNYSPALGIVLPDHLLTVSYAVNNQSDSDSDSKTNQENTCFLLSNYIQEDISDKIRLFLKKEKSNIQERIKCYSMEQEKQFKHLYQSTIMNKNLFLRLIETIKIHHNIDDNNKENLQQQPSIQPSFDQTSMKIIAGTKDFLPTTKSTTTKLNEKKNSDEFDSIFDIDDLDVTTGIGDGGGSLSMESFDVVRAKRSDDQVEIGEELVNDDDDDLNDERRDNVFPLKESSNQQYSSSLLNNNNQTSTSNMIDNGNDDEFYRSSISGLPISSTNATTTNDHQKFQRDFYSHNQQQQQQQIANSLPIQIPHFARRNEREIEESFRMNPGESMADSIKKMARSVRNEIDIFDDRPRRRLNTGDLIKSRRFFN